MASATAPSILNLALSLSFFDCLQGPLRNSVGHVPSQHWIGRMHQRPLRDLKLKRIYRRTHILNLSPGNNTNTRTSTLSFSSLSS